jgi:RNA polymerase sigma factor (sigma-70 family)
MPIDNKHLSPQEKEAFRRFQHQHQLLFQNPLIRSFFKQSDHQKLLTNYLIQPDTAAWRALDDAFRDYYTGVKIVHYLSQTLHWKAVQFDKQLRREAERFLLTAGEEEGRSYPEDTEAGEDLGWLENPSLPLTEKIGDPALLECWKKLTPRQQQVLHYRYSEGLSLTETGRILHITQQGASKIHQTALKQLKEGLKQKGGGGEK